MVRSSFSHQNVSNSFIHFFLWGFGVILLILYLLGRVQIDFELRKNEAIKKQRRILESEITLLQVQIDSLKSYSRIVVAARAQGLEPPSSDQLAQLEVDLKGVHRREPETLPRKVVAASILSFSKKGP